MRPTKLPDSFSRGASPACLIMARAVVNRRGLPVSARIAAAPTTDIPGMEVTSSVRSSWSSTAVIRCSVSALDRRL
jgi:hypothetical protein